MFDFDQFNDLILKPCLTDLLLCSDKAIQLMAFTMANESQAGRFLRQIQGPALGIYQMEPRTYNDLWENYISKKMNLVMILTHHFNAPVMQPEERLIYDLRYATAMTRLYYAKFFEPLPEVGDMDALWAYYKKYYNTSEGKANKVAALNAYHLFRFSQA